jgi:hypothetical protein
MSRRGLLFLVALVAIAAVSFLWPAARSPLSSSSFGKTGSGHAALYDLLREADLARGRSFESSRRLTDPGTLWWIDPLGICDSRIARGGEVDILDAEDVTWPGVEWIRGGGVAVVFLQAAVPGGPVLPDQEHLVACDAVAGFRLPERFLLPAGVASSQRVEAETVVQGAWGGEPRKLPGAAPYVFEQALDWAVAARIARPGEADWPFVLSRSWGEGRLVVVADSGFSHNYALDQLDAAPFAIDLVAAFGKPRFDEREHGFLPETNAFRYLAGSPARGVYLGLGFLGLLYLWRGNALPARSVQEADPAAPTLETYVTSLAALYARSGDYSRVLERYRELTASRLKRYFGLSQELSRRALVERIQADRRPPSAGPDEIDASPPLRRGLASLTEQRPAANLRELEAAADELDALVKEVTR